jgi:DNA-binding response OmpR family regulator
MSPLRIVIAEDDALIAMDMAELLMGLGHDVCAIACTEAQAVDAGLRCEPDLMIVDGALADGSGVSAMAQVLKHRSVPYLYVTGDTHHTLQLAPDAVVVGKPFNLQELTVGMGKALQGLGNHTTDIDHHIV